MSCVILTGYFSVYYDKKPVYLQISAIIVILKSKFLDNIGKLEKILKKY